MGERLRREARLLGEGSVQGRLYKVKWYPGLVLDADRQERVHGEVYALTDPITALRWLDAYEGINASGPEQDQYRRIELAVRLTAGGDIAAWLYVFQMSVQGLQLIPGGRWLPERH
jgi:gamma-glutamylcyclotransferase (GGCT)/AIG2-like uncharacterized protein YtfP